MLKQVKLNSSAALLKEHNAEFIEVYKCQQEGCGKEPSDCLYIQPKSIKGTIPGFFTPQRSSVRNLNR
jgi:hypothetical protein